MKPLKCAVLGAALLFTLSAGMCEGTNPSELIAKVQAATVKVCGFVPVASTVAAILDTVAGTGGAATVVATAANGICMAVKPKTTLYSGATDWQTEDGTKIEGCWASDPKCQPDGTIKGD